MTDKNNDFEFFGFPDNEKIEVPDETEIPNINKRNRNPMADDLSHIFKDMLNDPSLNILNKNIDSETVKGLFSDEEKNILSKLSEETGKSEDDILNSTIEGLMSLLSGNSSGLAKMMGDILTSGDPTEDCDGDCAHCDYKGSCDECDITFEMSDPKYLKPETFGNTECIKSQTLYDDFIKKYGHDSSTYMDAISDKRLTEITMNLPLNQVKAMHQIDTTDTFILFYVEMDDPKLYGFYAAVFKTDDDSFALYIPEFQNSIDVVNKENELSVSLYDPMKAEHFFIIDNNKNATFAPLNISLMEMGINFILSPKDKVILSPHQFGTIKNIIPSPSKASKFLQIGEITSNESPEAILLKKDAELDLNETKFPIYVNFGAMVDEDDLTALATIFSKVDFNKSKLFDNVELSYNSFGMLYININLGEF